MNKVAENLYRAKYQKPYKKYWYYITEIYCHICAGYKVYRERRYGRKPENWGERHEIVESYDGCQG